MISYLYKLKYDDEKVTSQRHGDIHYVSPLDTNVKMYATGEKYGIEGLKLLALEKFEAAFDSIVFDPEAATNLGQFLQVLPKVYSSTPDTDDGLRQLAVMLPLTRQNSYKSLTDLPEFKSTIFQTPEFALRLISKTVPLVREGRCRNCSARMMANADNRCSGCALGH